MPRTSYTRSEEADTVWQMRASKSDKQAIARLAEHLGLTQSDAVRCAVAFALHHELNSDALNKTKFLLNELVGYSHENPIP